MNKKIQKLLTVFIAVCLVSGIAYAGTFDSDSNNDDVKNAKLAKISIVEAINKVTQAHDGIVITAGLEMKKNDQLVFEIDFVKDEKEIEVWVDARTGELSELMED